jgi:diguanylate cyclase (GGDEF)-like protein
LTDTPGSTGNDSLTHRNTGDLASRSATFVRRGLAILDTSTLLLDLVENLASAIDSIECGGNTTVRRTATQAAILGRALNMPEQEIYGLELAAMLRNIGKVCIPEPILSKSPLTSDEFQQLRIHPEVGAELIASVPFSYPVAEVIRHHHERWDGRGYPAGLKGEEIPIGSRILAVVDYFDALTSERPYQQQRMSDEGAVALLRQAAGTELDPSVVETFIEVLPDLQRHITTTAVPKSSVFERVAVAHRQISTLYDIAQAMGTSLGVADTMALISSKLSNLVPFSCCALFLHNEELETLRCRFATGIDAELIQRISVKTGLGMTGWVARNRRTLVNARPSADLEAAGIVGTTSLQSALVCPLVFNERFIGTLSVYHIDAGCYTDDHRRLLDRVCEQVAAVIFNSVVFEQTQEDSLTDPLTGLPNSRFMFMHLTRELPRAERLKSEIALVLIDMNGFRGIKGTHGRLVANRALCEVAGVLRAAIRPYDFCVRYEDDEFVVVLSGCGAEEAERKRLELKTAIDELVFEPRLGKRLQLGISAGAAIFPHDGQTYEALFSMAETRMQRDKRRISWRS